MTHSHLTGVQWRMRTMIVACSVWLVPVVAAAQGVSSSFNIAERFSLHSDVLNEDRPYWVSLPASYRDTTYSPDRYPVLYLLDGDTYLSPTVGVVQFSSSGASGSLQIPELIIVAVPNTNRTRDLTPTHTLLRPEGDDPTLRDSGGGDAFLKFLGEELIPHIDRTYRTKPYRVIVGHSFGGLFVAHAFERAPHVFQSYLAIDPSVFWDEEVVIRRLAAQPRAPESRPRATYIGVSVSYSDGYLGESISKLVAELEKRAPDGVRLQVRRFDTEGHQSVFLGALHQGLLLLFDGYRLGPGDLFTQAATLPAKFEAFSAKLGFTARPPERFVDQVATAFVDAGQIDRGIGVLRFNTWAHPSSAHAFHALALALEKKGDLEPAVDAYEKALQLDPGANDTRVRLTDLRNRMRGRAP